MARNRQKAKQRKARRERQGVAPVQARSDAASSAGEAPPQDAGFANTDAVEVKDELKREAKVAKKQPAAPAKAQTKGAAPQPKERGRLMAFLRSSWAELRRVQWPDRKQMTTMTSIVIGFVIIAGVYLGVIDWVANKVVNLII
ncbi:MAG: preprotein translocase subunit SecE [Actinobacteria bacterium]|nr:preprotein translocase subunit SecE [Actinomycetota bacterium]